LWPHTTIVLDYFVPAAEVAQDYGLRGQWREVLLERLDRRALSAADIVLVDTEEHRALLPPDASGRAIVVPIGASDVWFSTPTSDTDECLRVVFFGNYSPLQGTPIIGEAIALLAHAENIRITLIGRGWDYEDVRRRVGENRHVRWIGWLEPEALARVVAEHHVCLGIFGTTEKASRVVPTKVYEGAAAGCVIVTSSTPPQERALGPAGLMIPPGDARALANTLSMLASRPDIVAMARRRSATKANSYRAAEVVLPLHHRLIGLPEAGRVKGRHPGRRRSLLFAVIVGLLAAVSSVLMYAYPTRMDSDPAMISPQENVRFQLAQEWVRQGRPERNLSVFSSLPSDIAPALTPRDAALHGHHVVPKDFPYAIGLAALLTHIRPRLAIMISLTSAVALLAAVAALGRRIGGSAWSGVAAAGVMATTSAFSAGSNGLLNTGATLALAIVVAVLLLTPPAVHHEPMVNVLAGARPRRDVLAGVAIGFAVGLHHDAALLALGLVIPLISPPLGDMARAKWIAVGGVLALLPVVGYYTWLFGSPFTTGYAVGEDLFETISQGHSSNVFNLRPDLLIEHIRLYVLRLEILLLVIAAVLACRCASQMQLTTRRLAYGLALGGVPYLVFAGSRPLYGVDRFTIGASFLRYAVPVLALLVCLAAAAPWAGPAACRRIGTLAISIASLIGVLLLFHSAGGPLDQRRQVQWSEEMRAQVLTWAEPGALIVTARGDKFLWPQRSTLTAAYLVRNAAEGVRSGPGVYDVVPTPHRLADVVSRLVGKGERVYVLDDNWLPDSVQLDSELRRLGVRRERTPAASLFRISPINPAS
jgi:hypothetical protein